MRHRTIARMATALGTVLAATGVLAAIGVLTAPAAQATPDCHTIQVVTGPDPGAGTDENVYMTFYDQLWTPVWRELDNSANNFERGGTDTFSLCGVRPLLLLPVVKLRYQKRPLWPSGDNWQVSAVIVDGRRYNCRNTVLRFSEEVACS